MFVSTTVQQERCSSLLRCSRRTIYYFYTRCEHQEEHLRGVQHRYYFYDTAAAKELYSVRVVEIAVEQTARMSSTF